MKDTNEQKVADAFERAFDDMGDKALADILSAFNTFAIHQPGLVIKYLHKMALGENAYRNQSFADMDAERAA